ncbi:MAG: NAD-dependent epimerase/dehydratase family protein [Anaerolineales bacterium]
MKLLITGAAGFLGRNILAALAESEAEIHAVSRATQHPSEGITWHQANLHDVAQVDSLVETVRPSHLLHLAWDTEHGAYWHSLENYTWVSSSLHLARRFHENGGARLIVAGTSAEYDWTYGYCTEGLTPLSHATPYSACKISLYHLLSSYAERAGLSWAWGRVFFPFGPHENPKRLVPYVTRQLLADQSAEVSSGEQQRDFLYVGDIAAAFVALLRSDLQGAVNLSSGQPVAVKAIIERIAGLLGKPHLIKWGAQSGAPQAPMAVGDNARLRTATGWTPRVSLDEGLRRTIEWWQMQSKQQ